MGFFDSIFGRDGIIRKFGRGVGSVVTSAASNLPKIVGGVLSGLETGAELGSLGGPEIAGITSVLGGLGGGVSSLISGLSGSDSPHQLNAILNKGTNVTTSLAKHLTSGQAMFGQISKAASGGAFGQDVARVFPNQLATKIDSGLSGVHSALGKGRFALERFNAGVRAADPTAESRAVMTNPQSLGQLAGNAGFGSAQTKHIPSSVAYTQMVDRATATSSPPAVVSASSA